MKKWFVMALAACMLTGLLAGCGSKEEGSAQVDSFRLLYRPCRGISLV